jgi:hypothetical protein
LTFPAGPHSSHQKFQFLEQPAKRRAASETHSTIMVPFADSFHTTEGEFPDTYVGTGSGNLSAPSIFPGNFIAFWSPPV